MTPDQLENPSVLTGCDATIKMNGVTVGFLKNIEVNVGLNQQPVEAVGYWKPRGFKSTRWNGDLTAEFHILTKAAEGVIPLKSSSPAEASQAYYFQIMEKSTQKRIADAIGNLNTKGFSILTNELSGRRCAFVLSDVMEYEGLN